MATREISDAQSPDFAHALRSLHESRLRPEVRLTEVPAPSRLAPHAVAMTADIVDASDGEDLATGRFVLLHDVARPYLTRVPENILRRAFDLGFRGKLCIHPQQIAPVHRGFGPTPADIDWARRVVAADNSADGRAVALNGQMVDRPVVERARAILARAH